jgi:hypothetical protein
MYSINPGQGNKVFLLFTSIAGESAKKKFSYLNICKIGIKSWPVGVSDKLVSASLSSASWNRHAAAVSSLTRFLIHENLQLSWPLEIGIVRGYVNWALTNRKLSPETVKVYQSDLKMAHKIRNLEAKFENDFFIHAMIKGAKKLYLYSSISRRSKFVMSFPLLKLLGHEIAISNWS